MSEQRHFTKTKPIIISKTNGMEASPDAHYGPWGSISDYINWLREITLDYNVKPPIGAKICVVGQNGTECFTYNESFDKIGYWKDSEGGIVLSETDGNANKAILNALLFDGDVKLRKGNYPVDTGVVVDNVTFDLNSSCLTCASRNSKGLLQIKGEKPVVRNGELCGTFHDFDGNPNDDYESEGLIRCYLYGDAVIENMELHNCQGYAICHGNPDDSEFPYGSVTSIATTTEGENSESIKLITNKVKIPIGYKYVLIKDLGENNRVFSVRNVIFRFYNGDTYIGSIAEMPRTMVCIPEGATKVEVIIYRYANYTEKQSVDIIHLLQLRFSNIDVKCITIQNCCIHNNYRLGVIGMAYGTQKILNCRSYGHGKPTKESTVRNTNTVGFFNAEDNCTPKVIMQGCTSEDESNLALLGAYKVTVTGCTGGITVYRGWHFNISNCVGIIDTISTNILPMINVSNCVITSNPRTSPNWIGNNNVFIDCNIYDITRENNFIIRREHRTTGALTPSINGLVRGKIYNAHVTSGNFGIGRIATEKGSHFEYVWNKASDESNATQGVIGITGDSYGITANCPFYPNGKKIYDSKFTPIHSFGPSISNNSLTTNNYWCGEYINCTFNIITGAMFYCTKNLYGIDSENKTLVFRNCTINITEVASGTQHYLFEMGLANAVSKNFRIKFINCKISNPSLLFHPTNANNMQYDIIEYDDNIDALIARIEALEGN